jgi:hypothetical protein
MDSRPNPGIHRFPSVTSQVKPPVPRDWGASVGSTHFVDTDGHDTATLTDLRTLQTVDNENWLAHTQVQRHGRGADAPYERVREMSTNGSARVLNGEQRMMPECSRRFEQDKAKLQHTEWKNRQVCTACGPP